MAFEPPNIKPIDLILEDCIMFPEVMTVEQLAQYLQLEPAFVLKRIKKGDIPAAKINDEWRVRREKINQWLDELADLSPHGFDRMLNLTRLAAEKAGLKTPDDADKLISLVREERRNIGKR